MGKEGVENYETVVEDILTRLAESAKQRKENGSPHPRCWDASQWHSLCRSGGFVELHDLGGHPHLWCGRCGILRDIATVAEKLPGAETAGEQIPLGEASVDELVSMKEEVAA